MKRHRMKQIRRMAHNPEQLPRRIKERRERYQKMISLNAPEFLVGYYRSMWHDAEYALSIAEGYYNPSSEINQYVMREVRQRGGFEMTYADLEDTRRSVMSSIYPCVSKHVVPEYGAVIRFCRANGIGRKRAHA